MRCACGTLIRGSQVRCRPCALEFVRAIDTDRFEIVKQQVEDIMTESTKVNLSTPQRIASRDVEQWQAFQRGLVRDKWIRRLCVAGVATIVIVCAYVAYRIGR